MDNAIEPDPAGASGSVAPQAVGLDVARRLIRGRRTHKAYSREPLPREAVEALLELARWAPNHHLTQPWRFRVLGPATLSRLQQLVPAVEATKLERAPTLVLASCVLSGDPVRDEEDTYATAAAVYAVLLGAHAQNLAGYWRTPAFLREADARAVLGLDASERIIGLIHLGGRVNDPPAREAERATLDTYVTHLE